MWEFFLCVLFSAANDAVTISTDDVAVNAAVDVGIGSDAYITRYSKFPINTVCLVYRFIFPPKDRVTLISFFSHSHSHSLSLSSSISFSFSFSLYRIFQKNIKNNNNKKIQSFKIQIIKITPYKQEFLIIKKKKII